ncbi:MAG: ribonuclease P protein component [Treponema sp.]|jgi:ribonuclease P protein component|nr:ribonuclease P protein component [Treponema sp.]
MYEVQQTPGGGFRFRRRERLKGRNEIKAVFSRGKSFGCRGAKFFVRKNNLPYNRVCFTLSRKFGNAVERNRTRRLFREAYRHLRPQLLGGFDLILLVYPDAADPAGAAKKGALRGPEVRGQVKITGSLRKNGQELRAGQLRFLLVKAGLLRSVKPR